MISTLKELKEFLESKQIPIKSYSGWQLVIGKSTWGIAHDVLYCDEEPVTKKEILNRALKSVEKENENVKHQGTQVRKWRGISCRSTRRELDESED